MPDAVDMPAPVKTNIRLYLLVAIFCTKFSILNESDDVDLDDWDLLMFDEPDLDELAEVVLVDLE